jgi:hypothetical protein
MNFAGNRRPPRMVFGADPTCRGAACRYSPGTPIDGRRRRKIPVACWLSCPTSHHRHSKRPRQPAGGPSCGLSVTIQRLAAPLAVPKVRRFATGRRAGNRGQPAIRPNAARAALSASAKRSRKCATLWPMPDAGLGLLAGQFGRRRAGEAAGNLRCDQECHDYGRHAYQPQELIHRKHRLRPPKTPAREG